MYTVYIKRKTKEKKCDMPVEHYPIISLHIHDGIVIININVGDVSSINLPKEKITRYFITILKTNFHLVFIFLNTQLC